eukprot:g1459.t1
MPFPEGDKLGKDYFILLSNLKARTDEIRHSIDSLEKKDLLVPNPKWPQVLEEFLTLATQFSKLQEELRRPGALAKLQNSVAQPSSPDFDPTILLRTRPLPEVEEQQEKLQAQFAGSEQGQWDADKLKGNALQYNSEVAALLTACHEAHNAQDAHKAALLKRKSPGSGPARMSRPQSQFMLKPMLEAMVSGKRLKQTQTQ